MPSAPVPLKHILKMAKIRAETKTSSGAMPSFLGMPIAIRMYDAYIRYIVLSLSYLGEQIAARRKTMGLTQAELATKARLSRATVDALENGRSGELGFIKITNILSVLGLELRLQEAGTRRPTLEELMKEESDAQGLDRRR